MSIKLIPVLLIIKLGLLRCSIVIDNWSQKSIIVSDYCPAFPYCREGAHTMCVHYNPNQVMGPKCRNGQNITITEQLATQLLDITNAIRSKIANGKEKGKNGVLLPRGYGIFRLQWDNELATFAQVLANQCTLRHDFCRSTKRFPDPGQTVGLVRFSYPDWKIMAKKQDTPGLTEAKMSYAITVSLKNWYMQKVDVTEQMVKVYPDYSLTSTPGTPGRLYLETINGGTTHMGCGLSAFSDFVFKNTSQIKNIYNSIIVVCNYSARPQRGGESYTTEPPAPGLGYSPKCGCPPGSTEDQDCLCNLEPKTPEQKPPKKCNSLDGKGCEPTLVLLPIFTIEDAPDDLLFQRAESIKDPLKDFIIQSMYRAPVAPPMLSPTEEPPFSLPTRPALPPRKPPPPPPLPPPPPPPLRPAHIYHQNRAPPPIPPRPPPRKPFHIRTPPKHAYTPALRANNNHHHDLVHSDDELEPPKIGPPPIPPRKSRKQVTKKSSIFTKAAQFKLPGSTNMVSPFVTAKKDVLPRKDFSNLNKKVDEYLQRQRFSFRRNDVHPKTVTPHLESPHTDAHVNEITTETILKTAEEEVMNLNQYLKEKKYLKENLDNRTLDMVLKDENDKDNKLLSLLNTLEKEVKHVALDGNEKELFDAKIRRIYGSIVGATDTTLVPIVTTNPYDSDNGEIDIGNLKSAGNHGLVNLTDDEKHPRFINKNGEHLEEDIQRGHTKNYDYLVHSRKEKLKNDLELKKYIKNLDENIFSDTEGKHDVYDHNKYHNSYGHKYESDVDQKYIDDFENKYSEILDRNKFSDNNLDLKFDAKHKHFENDRKYHYDDNLDHKYEEALPLHRNTLKYENKDFNEFREVKHNSLTSIEDNAIKHSNLMKFKNGELVKSILDNVDREGHRSNDPEKRHRDKIDIKRNKIYHYRNDEVNEPLSIERRKYYQEKLENIEKRLRSSSRNGRRKNDIQIIQFVQILAVVRCSQVIDSRSQNALYVANYCPALKHCLEGTHVMCMYYNPDRTMGPLCRNYVTITITPQMVRQILKEVNEIRIRVASGKETGKDGRPLPRAYGMMKMFWDSELATLAQVLADKCMGLREDECRATDTFPNPSQIITLVNFKVPNWDYLSRNTTTRGLNKEKISFAIEKAMRSLHAVKKLVTPNNVYDCPALESIPDMGTRSYLKLIRGKATHIGCGISAYRRYQISATGAQNIYNSIQLVCNISDEPQKSQQIYTTDPPIPGTGFSDTCGCPHGYRETTGCLCERNPRSYSRGREDKHKYELPEINEVQTTLTDGPINDPVGPFAEEKPKVAILPIFEIQDVPPNSYEPENDVEYQFHRSFGNRSFFPDEHSMEENEISNEIAYKEISNDINKLHKIFRTNRLHNMPNKVPKKEFEVHDVMISEELKPERYDIYNRLENNIDSYTENEDKDSDRKFLSILDHLEKAVQDIELEGDARDLFDIKMRKIYEAGLKLKNQNVKTKTDVSLDKIKQLEMEKHLHKVRNYMQHKMNSRDGDSHMDERRHWARDRKINEHTLEDKDMNAMSDNDAEQKETESDEIYKIIDEKLIDILNKKFSNQKYMNDGRKYSDEKSYYNERLDEIEDNTLPPARKQENINRYENKVQEFKTGNDVPENLFHKKHSVSDHNNKMDVIKKLNEELLLKHRGELKQSVHSYDHTDKPIGIRPTTHQKKMMKKTRKLHKPSANRRVFTVIRNLGILALSILRAPQRANRRTQMGPNRASIQPGSRNKRNNASWPQPEAGAFWTFITTRALVHATSFRLILRAPFWPIGCLSFKQCVPEDQLGLRVQKWDEELATLAKVLANQCMGGREDTCRATEKFPNPSQSIAIIHFKYPNWEYIRHNNNNTGKGLNEEKLMFSMERFLKSAHILKKAVTKDIIVECPPYNDLPDLNLKYYLKLIRGGATHIGCGISAYSKYKVDGQTESIQNSVQVVCNISEGPQSGEPVYNTDPPIPGQGLTKRCGCPKGYKETRNCLCEKVSDEWINHNHKTITFRPHWDLKKHGFAEDTTKPNYSKSKSVENLTVEDNNDKFEVKMTDHPSSVIKSSKIKGMASKNNEMHSPRNKNVKIINRKNLDDIKPNHMIRKMADDSNESLQQIITKPTVTKKKYLRPKPNVKKNISFKKQPSILDISESNRSKLEKKKPLSSVTDDEFSYNIFEEVTNENPLNKAENNFVVNYQNKNQNLHKSDGLMVKEKKDDKRLQNVLNMLEYEVKNIDFDTNLKHFFDTKMKQIYKLAVNKAKESTSMKSPFKKPTVKADKILRDTKLYSDNNNNINNENEQVGTKTIKDYHNREQKAIADETFTRSQIDGIDNMDRNYDDVEHMYEETPIEMQEHIQSAIDNGYEDMPVIDSNTRNVYKISQNQGQKRYPNNDFKYNDILNDKYSVDRQYEDNPIKYEIRNQQTLLTNNSSSDIINKLSPMSISFKNSDNFDETIDEIRPNESSEMANSGRQDGRERKNIKISIFENERPLAEEYDLNMFERRAKLQDNEPQFTRSQQLQFDRQTQTLEAKDKDDQGFINLFNNQDSLNKNDRV
ncbi:unnamed protein product [Spodoptera exigua]|nr:unnamed protein product [Spodoptera exigua]